MNTDAATGRSAVSAGQPPGPNDGITMRPEEVLTELLQQQKTLLAELSWAYEQLERFQETDLAEIRSRLHQLEYQVSRSGKARFLSPDSETSAAPGWLASTRKRVEFTVRNPKKALRIAERRLRGEPSAPTPEPGRTP